MELKHKLAAQLYTVRNELERDFPGVLRKIKKMGWAGVQISGLRGYEPKEIAELLKETGLGTAGMHVPLDRLENDLEEVLKEAELFRTKDLVCPNLGGDLRNKEGYKAVRTSLNKVAQAVAPKGYRISYHNHAFEFETKIQGHSALEYLLEPVEENNILAEIDVYWVKKGGEDPLKFIEQYAHRMPIIHLKDMTNDESENFAEVGTGSIDFLPILRWGEQNGVDWYAVEQDVCPGDPLESLEISLQNLHKMIERV